VSLGWNFRDSGVGKEKDNSHVKLVGWLGSLMVVELLAAFSLPIRLIKAASGICSHSCLL